MMIAILFSLQLYYTVDFGETFTMLQSYVKSFSWSSPGDANMPVHLYVERKDPTSNYQRIYAICKTALENNREFSFFLHLFVCNRFIVGHFYERCAIAER